MKIPRESHKRVNEYFRELSIQSAVSYVKFPDLKELFWVLAQSISSSKKRALQTPQYDKLGTSQQTNSGIALKLMTSPAILHQWYFMIISENDCEPRSS